MRSAGEGGRRFSSWRVEGLRSFRLRAGLNNQEVLARRSGVTQQMISNLETGKGYVSAEMASRLAKGLRAGGAGIEVSPADLRLAHNLWVLRGKLERGEITPSQADYALGRIRRLKRLPRRPEQRREWEALRRRLLEVWDSP